MKATTMKNLLILFIVFVFGAGSSMAQCNATAKAERCIPGPESGFTLIKTFAVDGKGGTKTKIEYSYVFTKGTKYLVKVCGKEESPDGVVVTIYDKYRNKVASNLVDGKVANAIAFTCRATGIYYITYTFKDSQEYCGGSTIGFKRMG